MILRPTGRREIQLLTSGEVVKQNAEIYGPPKGELALFRIQHGWNITHVKTGMRIREVVGAKSLAIKVLEILLLNACWDFGDVENLRSSKDVQCAVRLVAKLLYPKDFS